MPRMPSYNPLAPSTNQKIQNYLDDVSYTEHRRRIKTATPAIDSTPPNSYGHLQVKLKKLQLESERHMKILQDNVILLQRMSDIFHSKGRFSLQDSSRISPKRYFNNRRRTANSCYPSPSPRRRSTKLFSSPLDIIIEELEEEWEQKRRLLSSLTETEATGKEKNGYSPKLCPRYIRDFGDGGFNAHGVMHVAYGNRVSTALPRLGERKTFNTTCEACKELGKNQLPVQKRKSSVRPKAAAPHRRRLPLAEGTTGHRKPDELRKEKVAYINLSREFEKEFGDLIENRKLHQYIIPDSPKLSNFKLELIDA